MNAKTEQRVLSRLINRQIGDNDDAKRDRRRTGGHGWVKEVMQDEGLDETQIEQLLEDWKRKGWYESGPDIGRGWLTTKITKPRSYEPGECERRGFPPTEEERLTHEE